MGRETQATRLNVYWSGELVGSIERREDDSLHFSYAETWVAQSKPALSLSLPLNGAFTPRAAHNFFANLLPEGDARSRMEALFRISPGNDFQCLVALGGDCAGAVSIGTEPPDESNGQYQALPEAVLCTAIGSNTPETLLVQREGIRLSLAGAQGKLAVRIDNGAFSLPLNGAPSTHIVKYRNSGGLFARLVENEFFVMSLARHVGLPVPNCQLRNLDSETVLIVDRYDRERADGVIVRLHQEDFCQALGLSHTAKYESEGGPSFAGCVSLARRHLSLNEVALLIDWFVFNLCVGNSDAHGKNISLVYRRPGVPVLAPFYDLVCTRAYRHVDKKLAMGVGGGFDPDSLSRAHFVQFARDVGISLPFLRARGATLAAKILEATARAKGDLAAVVNVAVAQQAFLTVEKLTERRARAFAEL